MIGNWQRLSEVLPDEIKEQLAAVILGLIGGGHGWLRVHFENRKISLIERGETILPVRCQAKAAAKTTCEM